MTGNGALNNVSIPSSVTRIGQNAFLDCNLITLVLPTSVLFVDKVSFYSSPLINALLPLLLLAVCF